MNLNIRISNRNNLVAQMCWTFLLVAFHRWEMHGECHRQNWSVHRDLQFFFSFHARQSRISLIKSFLKIMVLRYRQTNHPQSTIHTHISHHYCLICILNWKRLIFFLVKLLEYLFSWNDRYFICEKNALSTFLFHINTHQMRLFNAV